MLAVWNMTTDGMLHKCFVELNFESFFGASVCVCVCVNNMMFRSDLKAILLKPMPLLL